MDQDEVTNRETDIMEKLSSNEIVEKNKIDKSWIDLSDTYKHLLKQKIKNIGRYDYVDVLQLSQLLCMTLYI